MTAELAATFYTMGYANMLAQSMDKNQADLLVLTPEEYFSILEDKAKNNPRLEFNLRKILANSELGKAWKPFNKNASEFWVGPVAQSANDAILITKTFNALGIAGITTYVKTTATGTYIIIKGYAVNRSAALQGTRYLASNPKMIQMGLGMKALGEVSKGGFILGVVVSTGIEIADFIFNDQKTMYDLVGGIGVEAVKGGLGALVAYAAGAGVGLLTVAAVWPLVGMAVAALMVGSALNYFDEKHKIKERVIEVLKTLPENTAQGIYAIKTQSNSWLQQLKAQKENTSKAVYQGLTDWLCPVCRRY